MNAMRFRCTYIGVKVEVTAKNEIEAKQKAFELIMWKARQHYYTNINYDPKKIGGQPDGIFI